MKSVYINGEFTLELTREQAKRLIRQHLPQDPEATILQNLELNRDLGHSYATPDEAIAELNNWEPDIRIYWGNGIVHFKTYETWQFDMEDPDDPDNEDYIDIVGVVYEKSFSESDIHDLLIWLGMEDDSEEYN